MHYDFCKKRVLITGGTSGIGLAAAQLFLIGGARIALSGRQHSKGVQALEKLSACGESAAFIQGDVSTATGCRTIVEQTADRLGGIDIVVNSAGVYLEKAITETSEKEYHTVMNTNMNGTFFICKYAVPELKKAGSGAIVNVSSDAGINGNVLCTAYCASKGAVTTFTKALSLELAPYQIRANCVCPGDIATPMLDKQLSRAEDAKQLLKEMASVYPLGRIGRAEEAAHVICFLASDAASFVTGAAWTVDGGLTAC